MFLKIFLWFWLAIALVVGALTLVTVTLQTDPSLNRWQSGIGDALNVYADTARQIDENEGENGVQEFLQRLQSSGEIEKVCLANREKNNRCFDELDGKHAQPLINKAFESDSVEFEFFAPEENYVARKFTTRRGENFVLAIEIEKPKFSPFAADGRTRLLRILAVILTAGLLCYGLARYLAAPLAKLRQATKQFAAGDLSVRVFPMIGKRRDEISGLAEDFDEMAARIENLIAAQKSLITDISHELRSPLARLGVALEIARSKSNSETQPSLDRIERESARLNEMISQLLLLSKLETGTQSIEKQPVNLDAIVRDVTVDAEYEASSGGITVKLLTDDKCVVSGEARLLRSAIENVVRNAVRHTPEKASVEVALRRENQTAIIVIRDFGSGVAPEDLDKLFRPFFRVEYARTRSSGGFGLGLAIAERAILAHGGTISAVNGEPSGLSVRIELPVLS